MGPSPEQMPSANTQYKKWKEVIRTRKLGERTRTSRIGSGPSGKCNYVLGQTARPDWGDGEGNNEKKRELSG